jgi:hypothetical protein
MELNKRAGICYTCDTWMAAGEVHVQVGDPVWICYLCGEDLGDFATIPAGDCIECGHIVCEEHFGRYDESDCAVTCTRCLTT